MVELLDCLELTWLSLDAHKTHQQQLDWRPALHVLIFQKEKYIQIQFFLQHNLYGTSNDAVGLMMVVTLYSCITCISLQAVQTLLAAFKTAPQISYGDEYLIYSCEKWEEREVALQIPNQCCSFCLSLISAPCSCLLIETPLDASSVYCF